MSYLVENGFDVVRVYRDDMSAVKAEYGIPDSMVSCHTAIIEDSGYFVEGHIPVEAIDRLLAEKPDIDGIALPGMPPGSPGMGGIQAEVLKVYKVRNGVASPFVVMWPKLRP